MNLTQAQAPAKAPATLRKQPTELSHQAHQRESKIFLSSLLLTSSVLTFALFDLPRILTQFSLPQQSALSVAPWLPSASSLPSLAPSQLPPSG